MIHATPAANDGNILSAGARQNPKSPLPLEAKTCRVAQIAKSLRTRGQYFREELDSWT